MRTANTAALTLALVISGPATAATVWDESVNGDLSNNPLAPTVLTFAPGSNDVIGQAGGSPGPGALAPFDQDFFSFTVPKGYELRSLEAVKVQLTSPTDEVAFIAIQSGPQITHNVVPPFNPTAAGFVGLAARGPQRPRHKYFTRDGRRRRRVDRLRGTSWPPGNTRSGCKTINRWLTTISASRLAFPSHPPGRRCW
jgi:hypothetical protein